METYAKILLFAIPGFVGLILLEGLYGYFAKGEVPRPMDTISSLSSGMTNILKDALGLVILIISYPFLLEHLALMHIEQTWLVYLVAFIAMDFAGYWKHRLSHHVNYFWNEHIIHHSSEEFNLSCALRQSISNILSIFAIFLIPAAIFGVPHQVVAIVAPLHLFLQFWYHTRYIPKMGWLEYIIVTPSQHRVHHAINPIYMDKNLGQIFCLWDRIFGTFQEELEEEPPVYGVSRPVSTWNPIKINFVHLWLLIQDAWRTRSWWDKLRIWFMPTGWRPADVQDRYPVAKIEDVYGFEKYDAKPGDFLQKWVWFQFISTLVLLLLMFFFFAEIGFPALFLYGGFLFLAIYGYSSLMDNEVAAPWIELVRGLAGLIFIWYTGDWFGLSRYIPFLQYLILGYFLLTAVVPVAVAQNKPAGNTAFRVSDLEK